MFTMTFNGETDKSHAVRVKQRPDIPVPKKRVTEQQISGMDGVLLVTDDTYEPIDIDVELNFLEEPSSWAARLRDLKKWLLSSGWLSFSDDEECMYRVLYVSANDAERTYRRLGNIKVTFTCDPYMYVIEGQESFEIEDVLENTYEVSHPLYTITGSGTCVLTVNGSEMEAEVDGILIIDTVRQMAYTDENEVMNTAVTGAYEDLYLLEGTNTIEVTDGFSVSVVPNWRCL